MFHPFVDLRLLRWRKHRLDLLASSSMNRPDLFVFLFVAEGCIVLNGFPLGEFRDKNRPDLVLLTWTEIEFGGHHCEFSTRF